MKQAPRKRPSGMTMLEVLLATALMSTVMTAVAVLVRTSYSTWRGHEQDTMRIEAAHATLRHIVRQMRQASSVTAISAANDTSGTLSLLMPGGETRVWDHNSGSSQVLFGVGAATDLLAEDISELQFEAYEADGSTTTTVPADIHSVRCRVKVVLPVNVGGDRVVSCRGWIRSW